MGHGCNDISEKAPNRDMIFFARSVLDVSVCPSPAPRWCSGSATGRLSQPVATVLGLRSPLWRLVRFRVVFVSPVQKLYLMSNFCSFFFSSTRRTEQLEVSAGLGHVNEGFRPE